MIELQKADTMRRDVQKFRDHFRLYTELRFQENRKTQIACVDGTIISNTKSSESGVCARTGCRGRWGFSSSSRLDDETVKSVLKEAEANARFLGNKGGSEELDYFPKKLSLEKSFATKKKRWSQSELIGFIKTLDGHIASKYSGLTSRSVRVGTLDMEKVLLNSNDSFASSLTPRSLVIVVLRAEAGGEPISAYKVFGGLGHFEDNFDEPSKLYPGIEKLHKQLMDKKDAVYARAGVHDVVMDADLAGILAHEAVGHTTEADLVLGGSVAGDNMEKKVASELVTLVDFAHSAFGKNLPVPVYVDDEGVEAQDAVIIKDGVLKSFMHNKESANIFETKPTGNARAYEFSDEPLIRMRNTGILPGKSRFEDMIASIDDGYYLAKPSNGQADSTGEFMFGVPVGYEIKKGKLGKAIKDTTISGVAFDVLKSATMISDEFNWTCGGMCGKKQLIPVGMGGPAVKCRVSVGGQ